MVLSGYKMPRMRTAIGVIVGGGSLSEGGSVAEEDTWEEVGKGKNKINIDENQSK